MAETKLQIIQKLRKIKMQKMDMQPAKGGRIISFNYYQLNGKYFLVWFINLDPFICVRQDFKMGPLRIRSKKINVFIPYNFSHDKSITHSTMKK